MASKKTSKKSAKPKAVEVHETFTLRITPLRAPQVFRTVEVPASYTLGDVHAVIQSVLELDDDHLFSFFMTNEAWDQKDVYAREPTQPWERDAYEAPLASLKLEVGKQFLYLFDFGDELRHSIEVVARGTLDPKRTYPHLVDAHGAAPAQYEDEGDGDDEDDDDDDDLQLELAAEHQPLGDELSECIRVYYEFITSIDDEAEDEPSQPLETIIRDVGVAGRVLDALRATPDQFDAFDYVAGDLLEEWMTGLPFDLLEHERVDEALALATTIDEVLHARFVATRTLRAFALFKAGRPDEARVAIEAALAAHPDDPNILEDAADLYDQLEDPARAVPLWRKLVEMDVSPQSDDARERLGLVPEPPPRFAPAPFVNTAPKVGRNDPCPCGSGKKFKKCCG